ncbi:hypothetical protein GN156_20545, partial [bacterium LRH843]|nr:hypothetical protein [bacterium LRH843]
VIVDGRARATSEGDYLDSPNLSELEYHNYQPTNFNGVDVYNSLHPSLAGSGVPYHSDNPKPKTKKAKHRHGKRRRVTQEPDVKKPKRRRNKKRRGQKGEVPEDPDVPLIKNPDISTIEELTHIPQPQGTDVPAIQSRY